MSTGKTYFNVFRGSTIKRLSRFVTPPLVEDKPDIIIIIHVTNDITKQNMNIVNPSKLTDGIINIEKLCASYGVKDMSSILPKHSIK